MITCRLYTTVEGERYMTYLQLTEANKRAEAEDVVRKFKQIFPEVGRIRWVLKCGNNIIDMGLV